MFRYIAFTAERLIIWNKGSVHLNSFINDLATTMQIPENVTNNVVLHI